MVLKYKHFGFLVAFIVFIFGITTAHAAEQYRYVVYGNGRTVGLPVAGNVPSNVNAAGASASIPPVSQRSAQYYSETVDATLNRTNANTAIGRTMNGQVSRQSPYEPVPIDAKTRYYTPDNAYLEQRRTIVNVQ